MSSIQGENPVLGVIRGSRVVAYVNAVDRLKDALLRKIAYVLRH